MFILGWSARNPSVHRAFCRSMHTTSNEGLHASVLINNYLCSCFVSIKHDRYLFIKRRSIGRALYISCSVHDTATQAPLRKRHPHQPSDPLSVCHPTPASYFTQMM